MSAVGGEAKAGGLRIGVDLGGSKIEAIALDLTGGERARKRIPAPQGDYCATIRAVAELAGAVRADAGGGGVTVGVGTPGSCSPATGLMRNANSTWLNGRPLEADLAAAIDAPLRMANDANCFAVSEAADGGGAGASSVFGVIIGTGVGGGLVWSGRLIGGANGVAGDWGHSPLPGATAGRACWCGRADCIEAWLSGPALAADHAEAAGTRLSAAEIAAAAETGATEAVDSLDRYVARFGRALALVVNIFDPEVIVLGGGVSNIGRLYRDLPGAMRPHVFADDFVTRVVPNVHGDSSGGRGAARLWPADALDEQP